MTLRDALKADFGIEVLVEHGSGQRDDPFVIGSCSARDATRTQLNLLRGLERGRGELWRLLTSESAPDIGPAMQRLRIEAVLFTQTQIINETRAYYFDISHVDGTPDACAPLVEWADPRTTFATPFQVGWLHFDRAIDNHGGGWSLNTTLQYSSVGAKAAIYIYGSASQSSKDVAERELRTVCDQIFAMHPHAESPWPVGVIEPFMLQHFLVGEDLSTAGVGVLGSHFLKLRLTCFDDGKMRELMGDTVRELARIALKS